MSLDRYAWIDMLLLDVISGPGGEKELQKQFLTLMPSDGEPKDLTESAKGAKALMESDLFIYANASSKGTIQAACKIIEQLHGKVAPKPPAKATPFLMDAWSRAGFFAQVKIKEAKGEDAMQETLLMGKPAVQHLWGQIQKAPRKELTLEKLDGVAIFSWMLEEKQREELHTITMQVMDASSRKHRSSKKRTEPEESKAKMQNEISSARAFLGLD